MPLRPPISCKSTSSDGRIYSLTVVRHEIPEMIASIDPLKSGFALDDPADPRHQYMTTLKQRCGEWLHKASEALRSQNEENILDAVLMLVGINFVSFATR